MWNLAPFSVVVLGILGLAVVLASVARMVVLERHSAADSSPRGSTRVGAGSR
jgi:hypothetical protein